MEIPDKERVMLTRKSRWIPLLVAMIVFSATVARAQSGERPDGNKQQETFEHGKGDPHQAIVGTWMGITSTGVQQLTTFGFGGTVINSVPGQVRTPPGLTHTSHHGVWRHLGGRRFGLTMWDIFYDQTTGQVLQYTKIRSELTLDSDDEMSAIAQAEVINLRGEVVVSRSATVTYSRIQYEPLD
jgi:hypothetical protein